MIPAPMVMTADELLMLRQRRRFGNAIHTSGRLVVTLHTMRVPGSLTVTLSS